MQRYTAGQIYLPTRHFSSILPGVEALSPIFPLEDVATDNKYAPAPSSIAFEQRNIQSLIEEDLPSHQFFIVILGYLGQHALCQSQYCVRKANPDSPLAKSFDDSGPSMQRGINGFMPERATPKLVEASIVRLSQQYSDKS